MRVVNDTTVWCQSPSMTEPQRDGWSLCGFEVRLTLWERTLPHPTSSGAPSRREPLDVRYFMGMGFARSLCNTKAKLAIKHNDK